FVLTASAPAAMVIVTVQFGDSADVQSVSEARDHRSRNIHVASRRVSQAPANAMVRYQSARTGSRVLSRGAIDRSQRQSALRRYSLWPRLPNQARGRMDAGRRIRWLAERAQAAQGWTRLHRRLQARAHRARRLERHDRADPGDRVQRRLQGVE